MKYQLKSKFPRHWNCFITWHRLYEESTTQISLHPLPPLLHTPLHNLNPNTDTLNCTHWLIWTIHIYVDNRLFVTHTATHIVYHTHTPEVQNIDCNAMLHTHTHTHTHTRCYIAGSITTPRQESAMHEIVQPIISTRCMSSVAAFDPPR